MSGGKGKIRPEDGKPFIKGDSRINRAGRPTKLPDLDELLKEVLGEGIRGKVAMKLILLALRKKAMRGDVRAAELLQDRGYGKVKLLTEHSGSVAVPITGINYIIPDGNNDKANK
jgi:hypothetical protein